MRRYAVLVRTTVGTWTRHSVHKTRAAAQDQADLVHGEVVRFEPVQENGEEAARKAFLAFRGIRV